MKKIIRNSAMIILVIVTIIFSGCGKNDDIQISGGGNGQIGPNGPTGGAWIGISFGATGVAPNYGYGPANYYSSDPMYVIEAHVTMTSPEGTTIYCELPVYDQSWYPHFFALPLHPKPTNSDPQGLSFGAAAANRFANYPNTTIAVIEVRNNNTYGNVVGIK